MKDKKVKNVKKLKNDEHPQPLTLLIFYYSFIDKQGKGKGMDIILYISLEIVLITNNRLIVNIVNPIGI